MTLELLGGGAFATHPATHPLGARGESTQHPQPHRKTATRAKSSGASEASDHSLRGLREAGAHDPDGAAPGTEAQPVPARGSRGVPSMGAPGSLDRAGPRRARYGVGEVLSLVTQTWLSKKVISREKPRTGARWLGCPNTQTGCDSGKPNLAG